jgi:hypothetical protein
LRARDGPDAEHLVNETDAAERVEVRRRRHEHAEHRTLAGGEGDRADSDSDRASGAIRDEQTSATGHRLDGGRVDSSSCFIESRANSNPSGSRGLDLREPGRTFLISGDET